MLERADGWLEGEVQVYNDYLSGSVYYYTVEDPEGEHIDSCGGFYGYDHENSGLLEYAKNAIDCNVATRVKQKRKEHIQRNYLTAA